jgi:hypothetical protein
MIGFPVRPSQEAMVRQINPRSLFFVGVLLIFTPMVIQGAASIHDKEQVAEFYRRNPNTALLPRALEPSGFAGYHWACFGIGVSLMFAGLRESKLEGATKPEAWEHAEV